ncbi:hypothetical protein GGTG_13246 [Gaeumannomyces tritici R3-111a-1]|uniref:Heterokaryon incompatibility domain-containing protein n=1 Tax=Gaeumannomyces tritici (strain R3-111a-1) TaxID=644352 RepID=J3PIB8_GAET3|nr:hypothetical protein GGTG_13246 [Gaeumannomyces tritici R3-111a-1]EJT69137.1 hypothetical protein GGTG_13246 [Gaeumannomyces tritici R3-111a-1]
MAFRVNDIPIDHADGLVNRTLRSIAKRLRNSTDRKESDALYKDLPKDSVRLLRLLPHQDENSRIECQLITCSILDSEKTHPYEALSYVWGSEKNRLPIHIDGVKQLVQANLHRALLHLRDCFVERILWIDAICINQKDNEEKGQQVQSMAKIYAKASRVIVWLADPPDNGDQADNGNQADSGDQALEAIRTAAEEQRVDSQLDERKQQVILSLLRRKWFQRIWVLQEVAAARHILIKHGSTEIDGYAFCSGLDVLKPFDKAHPDLQALIPLIAHLIRGAVFRRRHERDDTSRPARFSLNIRPLGELVDMYHTRKATEPLDKVYALLGMSSDAAEIEANYKASWEDLFRKLINFSLSDQVSVSTWEQKEVAVIEAKGCVLGEVSSAGDDANQDGQKVEITWKTALDLSDRKEQQSSHFALQPSAKAVEKGDVVCLLQGASKPTIIRLCDGFSAIVRIAGPATDRLPKWPDSETALPADLLLIWDWDESKGKSQGGKGYEHLVSSRRVPKCPNTECQCQDHLDKASRLWNFGILLNKVWRYDEAVKNLRKAVEVYGTGAALRSGDSPYADHGPWKEADKRVLGMMDDLLIDDNGAVKAKDKSDLASLSRAISNGREAVIQLLVDTCKADIESKDKKYGQTPLSRAISNGHEAVILLLDTGKVDLESKDKYRRTPLSRAAGNGHEAVVKLLLGTGKVDADSKGKDGRTPLSWAARGGHEAVVKLLLGTGKVDADSKDKDGQTPLSWAARGGHKAVVKLLSNEDGLVAKLLE